MESFEITFFCAKHEYDENSINIFHISLKDCNSFGNKSQIELFNEEDKDFIEIRLSIFDLIITKDNFYDILKEMERYVSAIFEKINSICFATGIYELTYYLIENKKCLHEFNESFLQKFPIVFFRAERKCYQGKILFENDFVICVFNENAQVLY